MNKELNGNMEMFYVVPRKTQNCYIVCVNHSLFLQIFLRITQVNRTAHYVSFASAR